MLTKSGSHLLPLEMLFCFFLGREAEALLDASEGTAICTECAAHASEFLCLWTPEFHIVAVGTQL